MFLLDFMFEICFFWHANAFHAFSGQALVYSAPSSSQDDSSAEASSLEIPSVREDDYVASDVSIDAVRQSALLTNRAPKKKGSPLIDKVAVVYFVARTLN